MRTVPTPLGQAMYVASTADWQWLQSVQRKLYTRSWTEPGYVFEKLWGLVTDPRNLRCALARVARNRGRKTAGVDKVTVHGVHAFGIDRFLTRLRWELRLRVFRPSPVRRVMIPKPGKRGQFRPLGIPTVKDRVVQAALKNVLEPIFEADFYPQSFGFRPETGAHAALERLRLLLTPQPKSKPRGERRCAYQVAIEGDIKGCFDHIDHHGLMNRLRRRVRDPKVNRLIVAFLRAGVLTEGMLSTTDTGTPQGGILSPLLANIALSLVEERYERHSWPRHEPTPLSDRRKITQRAQANRASDRRRGRTVITPIRYADDFLLMVSVPPGPDHKERALATAEQEKDDLARELKERLGLELSPTKTLVTLVTNPLRFLGHHARLQNHHLYGWLSNAVIPKARSRRLRETIKGMFDQSTTRESLKTQLEGLNRLLRGWGYYYRHARGAKQVFVDLDRYVWTTVCRWLHKKHPRTPTRELYARYGWRKSGGKSVYWSHGSTALFMLSTLRVERFQLRWLRSPSFAETSMESPVRNERRMPGLEEGAPETAG